MRKWQKDFLSLTGLFLGRDNQTQTNISRIKIKNQSPLVPGSEFDKMFTVNTHPLKSCPSHFIGLL